MSGWTDRGEKSVHSGDPGSFLVLVAIWAGGESESRLYIAEGGLERVTKRYYAGERPVAMDLGGRLYYQLCDPTGLSLALVNEQNQINQILSQAAADSRLVCRREAQIGSLRTTTQCKTVAERRRDAQEAQEALRRSPTGTYNKGS